MLPHRSRTPPGRRRPPLVAPSVLTSGLLLAAACSAPAPEHELILRDSAGVTIVESPSAAWSPGEEWIIDPEPRLDLGSTDGEGPTAFGRVTDVAILGANGVVVADALASELRLFSLDGEFLRVIGGPGQGPGEFRSLGSVHWVGGDTLLVFDRGLRRLSSFLISGELLSTVDLGGVTYGATGDLAFLDDVAPLGGGALVGREGGDFSGQAGQLGLTRDTTHFLAVEGNGSGARLLDRVPGAWTLRWEVAGRRMFMLQPMTTYPTWTTRGDTLYIAPGEWAEVRVVGQEGVHRILRRSVAPRALEAADRSAWEEGMLRLSPEGDRDEARRLLDDLELPQRLPFYRNVLVDPAGHVWAERFESPGLGPGLEWDIYHPDGRYRGPVTTPSDLAIYEVGLDHVLGIWADDLGVQRVRVHQLERGALADQAAHGERSSSR